MASSFENASRLNDICPYFTRFELAFPASVLQSAGKGERVLDPFCGSGTTLFAARMAGLYATGVDGNPVAVAVARAKLATVSLPEVMERAGKILASENKDMPTPEGPFWEMCFSEETLASLTRFRSHFSRGAKDDTDAFLTALVAGLLHGPGARDQQNYFSNHMPSSFAPAPDTLLEYWRTAGLKPPRVNILKMIERRTRLLLGDMPGPGLGRVILGDSRSIETYPEREPFDRVITSPPYFGLNTYISDQWLRMWLLGDASEVPDLVCQDDSEVYTHDLARVWRNCASLCRAGATLAIRFGMTADHKDLNARSILECSLHAADAGWHVDLCEPFQTRAKDVTFNLPFRVPAAPPVSEFTLYAHLQA